MTNQPHNRNNYVTTDDTMNCNTMDERHLRVALSDDDIQRAKEYADARGLRMPRAYADLIRAGLNAEDD